MHTEEITLDRVFDTQRHEAGRFTPRRTGFSFESAGTTRYGVTAPGWPELTEGHRLTVMLGQAGNWQTLVGWVNRSTGETVQPDWVRTATSVVVFLHMTVLGGLLAGEVASAIGRVAAGLWMVVSLVSAALLGRQGWRQYHQSDALERIRRSLPTPHGPPATPMQGQRQLSARRTWIGLAIGVLLPWVLIWWIAMAAAS